jgi:hypothetical protein
MLYFCEVKNKKNFNKNNLYLTLPIEFGAPLPVQTKVFGA